MTGGGTRRMVRAFAPGRVEIAGNHTDHQGGRAVAATIEQGITMTLEAAPDSLAHLDCGAFGRIEVDVADLAPKDTERNTTSALVRGVIAGLAEHGIAVDGFSATVKSSLPSGGGLSSSAAFELALARGLELMFAPDSAEEIAPMALARIGRQAESGFFGKPCGLLDQAAIAEGGISLLDFIDAGNPCATQVDFDFEAGGYTPVLVDVGSDHSRYTAQYAQVAADMSAAAKVLGASRLGELDREELVARIGEVRFRLGDLAALRALHFANEMKLVDGRVAAMAAGDTERFLELTRRSGASSAQYLQNASCGGTPDQPAMFALALADTVLEGRGATRIHGGGFGGSIQAFVPAEATGAFISQMETGLFEGCCHILHITTQGAYASWI